MSREPTSARAPNSDGGGSPSKDDTQAEGDGDGGETTSDGDGSDRRKKNGFLLGGEKAKDASIQVRREEKVAACSGFSRSDDVGLEKENNLHCNSIFTLFVDGISDGVNYLQVRGLFAQIGRVLNVFIQRQRKIGRSHRFGFARFSSLEVASQAINLLDGFRLGGTPLSVAWARFPRRGVAGSRVSAARDQRSSEHAGVLAGIGEVGNRRLLSSSESEELMISGLFRGGSPSPSFSTSVLFPETSSADVRGIETVELSADTRGFETVEGEDVMLTSLGVLCDVPIAASCCSVPGSTSNMVSISSELGVSHDTGFSVPRDHVKTPRGRPKKGDGGGRKKQGAAGSSGGAMTMEAGYTDAEQTGKELMVLPTEMSEPYGVLTRARSAVLMGKRLGLRYDCPDDIPLFQIANEIKARKASQRR